MKNNNLTTQERPTREQRPERMDEARPLNRGWLQPQVNIVETKDAYLLEAEMPGVTKNGLEILLENNELTIVGRRDFATPDSQCVYRECANRDFRRTFELDPTIDTSKITARIENGVLSLELPKAEKVKPRRITVE